MRRKRTSTAIQTEPTKRPAKVKKLRDCGVFQGRWRRLLRLARSYRDQIFQRLASAHNRGSPLAGDILSRPLEFRRGRTFHAAPPPPFAPRNAASQLSFCLFSRLRKFIPLGRFTRSFFFFFFQSRSLCVSRWTSQVSLIDRCYTYLATGKLLAALKLFTRSETCDLLVILRNTTWKNRVNWWNKIFFFLSKNGTKIAACNLISIRLD